MKTWGAIALLLGACAGPVPECVNDRPSQPDSVWPQAVCGEFRGYSVTFTDHGDGTRSAAVPVCSNAWALACDEDGESLPFDTGRVPACSEVGGAPACDLGGSPHCVVIPCDGETYYGPEHAMAGG